MIDIKSFYDHESGTFSYVLSDVASAQCAVIDPVLNFDPGAAKVVASSADQIVRYICKNRLSLRWILETHIHSDHLSAADYLRCQLGGKIGIGENVRLVKKVFSKLFNFDADESDPLSHFDQLFADGDTISLGETHIHVLQTPGHTPACVSYRVDGAVFVGDTLFQPLAGTARADFPGGDAHLLYQSIKRLLALPPDTVIYLCHDYPVGQQAAQFATTVGEQRRSNVMLNDSTTEAEFVANRTARDKTLDVPALFYPALQVNIKAGTLPVFEDNGIRYLKIPLGQLAGVNEQ